MTIEKLEALQRAATAGPWHWSDKFKTRDNDETWSLLGGSGYGILSCDGCGNSPQLCNKHDAELIVEMRSSLEALLAVAKAAKKMRSYQDGGDDYGGMGPALNNQVECAKELDAALAQLEATP